MKKIIYVFFAVLLISFSVSAQEITLVEKGDLLKISTAGIEEYNFLKYVNSQGEIVLPYIGKIRVEGLDTDKISNIIQNKLMDGYFRDPQVAVEIEKSAAKKVFMFGLVRDAGEFEYKEGMRLLELVSLAGGYVGNVEGLIVKIFRNNKKVGIFRLNKIISYNRVNYNVEILPGDIVCILSEGEEDEI